MCLWKKCNHSSISRFRSQAPKQTLNWCQLINPVRLQKHWRWTVVLFIISLNGWKHDKFHSQPLSCNHSEKRKLWGKALWAYKTWLIASFMAVWQGNIIEIISVFDFFEWLQPVRSHEVTWPNPNKDCWVFQGDSWDKKAVFWGGTAGDLQGNWPFQSCLLGWVYASE